MVFEDLDPSTGYHFCPCWHCVPSLILGWGTQIVSAKIQMRKYPVTPRLLLILYCLYRGGLIIFIVYNNSIFVNHVVAASPDRLKI